MQLEGRKPPFFADDDPILTDAERSERDRKRREIIRRAQQEETRRRAEAARKAAAIWEAATPASADHPYLLRKQIPPVTTLREADAGAVAALLGYAPKSRGEPLAGRLLVAPVQVGGKVSTAELVDEAGRKAAIAGGAKAGGYWAAQPLPDDHGDGLTLLIGEGVATVLSATEATGCSSIAALSCGNLPTVARAMRERYPAARLVILADLGNGQKDAEDAARSVGG